MPTLRRALFVVAIAWLSARPAGAQDPMDVPRSGFARTDALEVSAVAATGAGHLAFSAMDRSRWFIPLAALGWGSYFYHRHRTEQRFLPRLGLTPGGLGPAFRDASLVAAGSAAAMAGFALWQDQFRLHRDLVWLFALYPAWGLLQQTLTQGMGAANLREVRGPLGSPLAVTLTTAALFGAVHVPNWKLVGATTALGMAFTPLYLRHGNLWPLGLYHGWLGALFYFWVLDENPWRDIVTREREQNAVRVGWGAGPTGQPAVRLRVRF